MRADGVPSPTRRGRGHVCIVYRSNERTSQIQRLYIRAGLTSVGPSSGRRLRGSRCRQVVTKWLSDLLLWGLHDALLSPRSFWSIFEWINPFFDLLRERE